MGGPAASPFSQNRSSTIPVGAGQLSSRFPPRKSSMSSIGQQEGPDTSAAPAPDPRSGSPAQAAGISDTPARSSPFGRPADIYRRPGEEKERERQSTESGRPSLDNIGRGDGASSRSSLEQRRKASLDRDDGTSRGSRSTLTPVAERKSEYGNNKILTNPQVEGGENEGGGVGLMDHGPHESNANSEEADLRRLSIGLKLPEMSRISGFGDDFFSNSIRYSNVGLGSSLQSVSEGQAATQAATQEQSKAPTPPQGQRSSVLDGPRLEPSPNIKIPSPSAMGHPGAPGNPQRLGQQPSESRPQLPGGWVSETSVLSSEQATPMGTSGDNRRISVANVRNAQARVGINTVVPDDMEPTTKVKHLPSSDDNEASESGPSAFRGPGAEEFGAFGHHDDGVASKMLSTGPGYHPTPHSLPPLQTDSPVKLLNAQRSGSKSPVKSSNTDSSLKGVPQASPGNQSNTATPTTTPGFPPAAPLNAYRLSTAPSESAPDSTERQSTMSTVGTASPIKESDKLREEIMRSLSPNPMSTPNSGEAVGNSTADQDDDVLRESRYLSGVYDDYLSLTEDKTLQETGRAIRNETMSANQPTGEPGTSAGAMPQRQNPIPEVAPLSPKRTPDLQQAKPKKRFSWEQSPESEPSDPVTSQVTGKTSPLGVDPNARDLAGSPAGNFPVQPNNSSGSTSLPENAARQSPEHPHPVDIHSRALSPPIPEQPSPISLVTDENPGGATSADRRGSLAEEKVLIESSHLMFASLDTEDPMKSISPSPPIDGPATEGPQVDSAAASPGASAATPLTQQPKVMPFREILSLPSSDQRTQKFDETRNQFFAMESGLSNWLIHMKAEVEGADGTAAGDAQQDSTGAQAESGPVGMQPSTQQPYYQQYLNASAPNAAGSLQRTMSGNLLGQSGSTASGFNTGHHHQVGAKGKELLHAAGAFGNKGMKSGMKLFNKGKSKLRERTGDKVFF